MIRVGVREPSEFLLFRRNVKNPLKHVWGFGFVPGLLSEHSEFFAGWPRAGEKRNAHGRGQGWGIKARAAAFPDSARQTTDSESIFQIPREIQSERQKFSSPPFSNKRKKNVK